MLGLEREARKITTARGLPGVEPDLGSTATAWTIKFGGGGYKVPEQPRPGRCGGQARQEGHLVNAFSS